MNSYRPLSNGLIRIMPSELPANTFSTLRALESNSSDSGSSFFKCNKIRRPAGTWVFRRLETMIAQRDRRRKGLLGTRTDAEHRQRKKRQRDPHISPDLVCSDNGKSSRPRTAPTMPGHRTPYRCDE